VLELVKQLKALGVRVKYDDNDNARPGWKFAEYEMKGVPIRITIGPKDLENNAVEVARRDLKEKRSISLNSIANDVAALLDDIQNSIFNKAKKLIDEHITEVNTWEEFLDVLESKTGFLSAHWDGTGETEEKIKELTKATIRCIPFDAKQEDGFCVLTGRPSKQRVLFAKAY